MVEFYCAKSYQNALIRFFSLINYAYAHECNYREREKEKKNVVQVYI